MSKQKTKADELLAQLVGEYPHASREEIAQLLKDEARADPKVIEAIADEVFDVLFRKHIAN